MLRKIELKYKLLRFDSLHLYSKLSKGIRDMQKIYHPHITSCNQLEFPSLLQPTHELPAT